MLTECTWHANNKMDLEFLQLRRCRRRLCKTNYFSVVTQKLQTEEEEGVDHSRYLASDKKQERTDKQSQIRQAEGEIQAAEHSRRPESDEDDTGRQVDLLGVKSSRRGRHCQGSTLQPYRSHLRLSFLPLRLKLLQQSRICDHFLT